MCAQIDDTPLAFCDPRSVDLDDVMAVDRPSENFHAEIYFLKSNPNQNWYYLSRQRPHEVFIFVSWDSDVEEGHLTGKNLNL